MSLYWNKVLLKEFCSKEKDEKIQYKLHTKIGNFYFYFTKDKNSQISGKLIFYPRDEQTSI